MQKVFPPGKREKNLGPKPIWANALALAGIKGFCWSSQTQSKRTRVWKGKKVDMLDIPLMRGYHRSFAIEICTAPVFMHRRSLAAA